MYLFVHSYILSFKISLMGRKQTLQFFALPVTNSAQCLRRSLQLFYGQINDHRTRNFYLLLQNPP